MRIRGLSIGARLIVGFGLVLGILIVLVAGTTAATSYNKKQLIGALERSNEKGVLAVGMKSALLEAGIAMRNIGLQSDVGDMQREAAQVVESNRRYVQAAGKLKLSGLDGDEQKIVAETARLQGDIETALKTAMNDALSFNMENATRTIAGKIDPLNKQAVTEVEKLVVLQQRQARAVLEQSVQDDRRLTAILFGIGTLALLIGAGFAWAIRRSIVRPLHVAVEVAARVAQGDLTSHVAPGSHDEIGKLLGALGQMNQQLASIVGKVRSGTDTITAASIEIASGNHDLSGRTEAQAQSLQETAGSMGQLTTAVRFNANNAQEANRLVISASDVATRGGEVVARMVATMEQIKQSSSKIREITSVIDGIAFQTNILALNAAVEAARAGAQGRGFAVVASEVRSLAQRSAAAAKEISQLIADSVEKVEAGSVMVDDAGSTMNEVVVAVRHIADIVGEIAGASEEQTQGIEKINEKISLMDDMTQRNAALVEEAAAAAESMRDQAALLADTVSVFKLAPAVVPPVRNTGMKALGTARHIAPLAPARQALPRAPLSGRGQG
ncbi:methyl-accepting chemotaxis protein [Herbaspirillum lusitanum]|uniref:Methyl-accepting chemotaxis protein n=1 Tax=Herbaspirillum lusitanum TaxID=213312 RepID=A0ABW9ADX1_9BURK